MHPDAEPSLDTELHRLRQWLGLFETWSDAQRPTPNTQALAQTLCQLLVQQAGYDWADVDLTLANGQRLHCHFGESALPDGRECLVFPVQLGEHRYGSLRVQAKANSVSAPQVHGFVGRMATDLAYQIDVLRVPPHQHPTGVDNGQVQLLAQAIEQSPFGIVVMDIDGRVEYCNRRFSAMTGYALDEIRGNASHPWNPADSTDAVYRSLLSSQHIGDHWNGDTQSQRKDGSTYWERQVVSTLRDADGQHTHLIVVKQDISARRGRKEVHEQTRRLQEQALVSSSNGIMITRSDQGDHSIVYVNPAFERITGYSAAEVIGLEGRFLVRDDLAQPELESIRSALREKREGAATLRNYRKDGTLFWNELHLAPVRDLTGSAITHFVSVINDVSERARAVPAGP